MQHCLNQFEELRLTFGTTQPSPKARAPSTAAKHDEVCGCTRQVWLYNSWGITELANSNSASDKCAQNDIHASINLNFHEILRIGESNTKNDWLHCGSGHINICTRPEFIIPVPADVIAPTILGHQWAQWGPRYQLLSLSSISDSVSHLWTTWH